VLDQQNNKKSPDFSIQNTHGEWKKTFKTTNCCARTCV